MGFYAQNVGSAKLGFCNYGTAVTSSPAPIPTAQLLVAEPDLLAKPPNGRHFRIYFTRAWYGKLRKIYVPDSGT